MQVTIPGSRGRRCRKPTKVLSSAGRLTSMCDTMGHCTTEIPEHAMLFNTRNRRQCTCIACAVCRDEGPGGGKGERRRGGKDGRTRGSVAKMDRTLELTDQCTRLAPTIALLSASLRATQRLPAAHSFHRAAFWCCVPKQRIDACALRKKEIIFMLHLLEHR